MKKKFFEIFGKLIPTDLALKYISFHSKRVRQYQACIDSKTPHGVFVLADLKSKLDQTVYVKGMKIEDCAYIEGYKAHIRELIKYVESDEHLNEVLEVKNEIENYERITATSNTATASYTGSSYSLNSNKYPSN